MKPERCSSRQKINARMIILRAGSDNMAIIVAHSLNLYYDSFHALKSVSMSIEENRITSIIGPSGCGKSTLLRVFNRINDTIEGVRVDGKVVFDYENIFQSNYDVDLL